MDMIIGRMNSIEEVNEELKMTIAYPSYRFLEKDRTTSIDKNIRLFIMSWCLS